MLYTSRYELKSYPQCSLRRGFASQAARRKIPILSDTTDEKTVSTPPPFLKVIKSRTLSARKSDSGARLVSWHHPRAPIAQGIEHRPPEAGAQVRILLGALPSSQKTRHLIHGHCPVRQAGLHFGLKLCRRNLKTFRSKNRIVTEPPIARSSHCY